MEARWLASAMHHRTLLAALLLIGLCIPSGAAAASTSTSSGFAGTHQPTVIVHASVAGLNLSQYQLGQYARTNGSNATITVTSLSPSHATGRVSTNTTQDTQFYVRKQVDGFSRSPIHLYYNGRRIPLSTVHHNGHAWYAFQLRTHPQGGTFIVRQVQPPSHVGPSHKTTPTVPLQATTHANTSLPGVRAGRANVSVAQTHAALGNVRYRIDSPDHTGTTLYVRESALNASLRAPLNQTVATLDGKQIAFTTLQANGTAWVAVNVPHFSAHTLTFQLAATGGQSTQGGISILGVHLSILELVLGACALLLGGVLVGWWDIHNGGHVRGRS